MGSFCKPSKQTSTSSQTSSTAPPDYIADAYKRLLPQLESAAATPWDPNTQQQVAGFSAPQMQGFQGVQNMQGAYQPYMNAAGAYTGLGALPATASVGNYMNPFVGNVVNAAMNDWQEQSRRTMQDVNSNAAKVGALTGDRSQVAQQLAREGTDRAMASNIANLYSQGYTQALGAAQTDAARALQAGQQFSALGGMAQQYGYADVNALMGIGGMQQGLQQQQYDAGTQNAMARAQYPFQSAQWLTGNLTGLGSAAGSTSTGTGKQTTPGPSLFQQGAGLAVAALGAFSDERIKRDISEVGQTYDGQPIYRYRMAGSPKFQIGLMAQDVEQTHPEAVGEVGGLKMVNYDMATRDAARPGYADGGALPYGKGLSYVPSVQVSSRGLQASPLPEMSKAAPASSGMDSLLSNYQQAKSAIEGGQKLGSWLRTTNDPDSGWSTTVNPSGNSGWRNYFGNMLGFSHGGRVGYYDGGGVAAMMDDEDRGPFAYYDPSPSAFAAPPEDDQGPFGYYNPNPSSAPTGVVAPRPAPAATASDIGPWATSVIPAGMSKLGASDVAAPNNSLGNLGLSDDAATALMAAGFGMMASNSPHFGVALGEGGLSGLRTYQALLERRRKEKEDKAKENEGKVYEMNGRLVRALPDGTVSEIYKAPDKDYEDVTVGKNRVRFYNDGRNEVLYSAPETESEASASNESFGLQPQYEAQPDGSIRPFVLGNRGSKKYLDVPEGSQVLGPEEVSAARSRGRVSGTYQGEARRDLPKALMTASETAKAIDQVLEHPSLDSVVGNIQGLTPNVFEGSRDVQARIDQLKGRAFLEAFTSLRGGGQITELEGKKATEAITRLNEQGVSEEAYRQALSDLRNIARNGAIMAQYQSGLITAEEALPQIVDFEGLGIKRFYQKSGTPSEAPTSGSDLVWNPATGKLEPSQ